MLILAACGGDKGEVGSPDGPGPTTTTAPPISKLTGLVLTDPSAAGRAAVTVKVDNSPDGRPQSGLDKTDVIFEEKVEGGVTRLLSVFQSQDVEEVGPVRSVRSTDVPIVTPIGGVFGYSGGIAPFVALIKAAPVVSLSQDGGSDSFRQKAGKKRPYATYTSTARLRSEAGDTAQPPAALFEFLAPGQPFAAPGATPATTAKIAFGPRTVGDWDYDAATGEWLRTTNGTAHVLEGGARLSFTNVIIQSVDYKATAYTDPSGSPVDEAAIVGQGNAIVLTQGMQVAATWSKATANDPTTYVAGGVPLKLPAGRTWVSLPPTGSLVSVS